VSWRDDIDQEEEMTFRRFQRLAMRPAFYPNLGSNPTYPVLGLNGEAGEVAEKVKKLMRDDGGVITEAHREAVRKELGDVLWYVAATAYEFGFTIEDCAVSNIEKLYDRMDRGKLKGSGDDR